jgi:FKBP-type peptidyl-prolyl cis-trans isomerase SlyD
MTPPPTTVADDQVVRIQYTLTVDGEVVDSSPDDEPFAYLHGHGNIVPGLEQALTGAQVGAKIQVIVAPADGYGLRDPKGVQKAPRSSFPDDAEVVAGMRFAAQGPDQQVVPVWVTEVSADEVTIDFNHPLAGKILGFAVTVIDLRAATGEELKHGHPHGPGGHHHH